MDSLSAGVRTMDGLYQFYVRDRTSLVKCFLLRCPTSRYTTVRHVQPSLTSILSNFWCLVLLNLLILDPCFLFIVINKKRFARIATVNAITAEAARLSMGGRK